MEIKRYRKFETNKFYPADMGEASHHVANEFSMVVRAGNRIFMRGQTAFDLEGNFHGENDVIEQTENACRCIKQLLEEAGGKWKTFANSQLMLLIVPIEKKPTLLLLSILKAYIQLVQDLSSMGLLFLKCWWK